MLHINRPWVCVINVCSNGGPTFIICEIIAKNNLNKAIVMQTFENLILQNCSTEFYDIAHTWSLVGVIKVCSNGGAT